VEEYIGGASRTQGATTLSFRCKFEKSVSLLVIVKMEMMSEDKEEKRSIELKGHLQGVARAGNQVDVCTSDMKNLVVHWNDVSVKPGLLLVTESLYTHGGVIRGQILGADTFGCFGVTAPPALVLVLSTI